MHICSDLQLFTVSARPTDINLQPRVHIHHNMHERSIPVIAAYGNFEPHLPNHFNVLWLAISNCLADKHVGSRVSDHYNLHICPISDICPHINNRSRLPPIDSLHFINSVSASYTDGNDRPYLCFINDVHRCTIPVGATHINLQSGLCSAHCVHSWAISVVPTFVDNGSYLSDYIDLFRGTVSDQFSYSNFKSSLRELDGLHYFTVSNLGRYNDIKLCLPKFNGMHSRIAVSASP